MFAIFKREFKSYFTNMSGYVFIGALWLLAGFFSTILNFIGQYASYEYILSNLTIVLMLVTPILTMRSIAEDKHSKTDTLLYSLPLKMSEIVIGKYLAMLGVFGVACIGMGVVPLILSAYGDVNLLSAYGSIIGFYMLGAALIAVCMFMSSLTEYQLIAALLGVAATLTLYLIGSLVAWLPTSAISSFIGFIVIALIVTAVIYLLSRNYIITGIVGAVTVVPTLVMYLINSAMFESALPGALKYLAVFDRFSAFLDGTFDVGAVVYYLSFIVFFVFLSVQSLDKRRWS